MGEVLGFDVGVLVSVVGELDGLYQEYEARLQQVENGISVSVLIPSGFCS